MAEIAVPSAGVGQETVARNSGTLKRNLGLISVLVFALSGISLTYSGMFPFSVIAGLFPGASLVGVLTVAAVVGLLQAYVYSVIGSFAPRSGADFVVASRVISPPLAFVSSWTLVIFLALAGGNVIASLASSTMPVFIQMIHFITGDERLVEAARWLTSPSGIVMIGTIGLISVFLLMILPSRVTHRLMLVGVILALVVWTILFIQLSSGSPASFQAAWEQFLGDSSYIQHLNQAHILGMKSDGGFGTVLVAGLLMGLWVFYGYFQSTYYASEVKEPEKNLLRGSLLALVISWAVFVVAVLLMQRLAPAEWLSAESYLYQSTEFKGSTMPWIMFYSLILHPSQILIWFMGCVWLFTLMNLAHTFLYTGSRVIHSWAADRLMPDFVAFVHPMLHSPVVAVLLVSIIAEFGVVEFALSGDKHLPSSPIPFIVMTQILPVLAIALMPFLKRAWFEQSVPFVRQKLGRIPVISLLGMISFVYLVLLFGSLFLNNEISGLDQRARALLLFCLVTSLAWYYIRRYFLMKSGDDFDKRFKQMPED